MNQNLDLKIKEIAKDLKKYEKKWLALISSNNCTAEQVDIVLKDIEKIKSKLTKDKYQLSTEMLKNVLLKFSINTNENNDCLEYVFDNSTVKFMKNKKTNYFWKIIYSTSSTKLLTTMELSKYDFIKKIIQTNKFDEKFPVKNIKSKKDKI